MNSQIKHHTARLRELLTLAESRTLSQAQWSSAAAMAVLKHWNRAQNFTPRLSDSSLFTYPLEKKKRKTTTELKPRGKASLISSFMTHVSFSLHSVLPHHLMLLFLGNWGTYRALSNVSEETRHRYKWGQYKRHTRLPRSPAHFGDPHLWRRRLQQPLN